MQKPIKSLLFLIVLTFCNYKSQVVKQYSYTNLNNRFDAYTEDDERAMLFVRMYILKAKKEHKFSKLIAGYEEAEYYSNSTEKKLKYADSALMVSLKSKDDQMISTAYMKRGIIYYYNKRDYRKALQEYLIAFKYAKTSKDQYLFNKILYHLGMVKCYLGFYQEAAAHFNETAIYYEKHISTSEHPNVKSNNEHGYLNSIYRLSNCYRNLNQHKKEDSLIEIGFKKVSSSKQFLLEYAYFQKAKGIQSLRKNNIALSEKYLRRAENILKKEHDFAALATVDFYIGKVNYMRGNHVEAKLYLKKVDSIIDRFNFVNPEVINNYKFLIHYAKEDGDGTSQLYYTNKLLRADSIITTDFAVLSKDP
jgi:tetratricopeptide (TPR) repeat protein